MNNKKPIFCEKYYKRFFLEIHPLIGGEESENWSLTLLNMYKKWFIKKEIVFDVVNISISNSGIKSVILKIYEGKFFRFFKKEMGLHKLIRLSIFDKKKKRHTSIAEVSIFPQITHNLSEKIKSSNIKINTFKSSGAGGQHVNTTDSAVRIVHIPTNIVVQSQNHRSQYKNKKECFSVLESKLYRYYKQKNYKTKRLEINYLKKHVRTYILHPYQLVKDYRSGIYTFNAQSVFSGSIDSFLYN